MAYTREQIERAIAEWQKRLRMQDWIFKVKWGVEPSEDAGVENSLGSVYQVPGCRVAHMCLDSAHLAHGTPEQISETIAHEIIHMVLEPLSDAVNLALDGASSERILLIQRVLTGANEIATETLTTAFCAAYGPPECLRSDESFGAME
jgi:hypothetical protein